MIRPWVDASTPTMEAYAKSVGSAGAMVFRFKGRRSSYAAYVMPDKERYLAAVAFPSAEEARDWADVKLGEVEAPLQERAVGA